MLIDIITNPAEALMKAKREKNLGNSLIVALVAAVLCTVGISLILFQLMAISTKTAGVFGGESASALVGMGLGVGLAIMAVVFFVLEIIAILLIGLLAGLVMKTLGGKGGFFEGLTVTAYSSFVASVAVVIVGILNFIPIIGPIIGGIVALLLFGISLAIMYRGLKELFETDMVTALIGVGVIVGAVILTFYLVFILFYVQLIAILGPLAMMQQGSLGMFRVM